MFEKIFGHATADIITKKVDTTVADKAAGEVLLKAGTIINTADKTLFSTAANAAKDLSPADLVAQLKGAKPVWTNDNRDLFKGYLDSLLNGIKDLRSKVGAPKTALENANKDLIGAKTKFIVPVNEAQGIVSKVDGQYRPVATQAQNRLNAAKGNMRTNLRPGADKAQQLLGGAGSAVQDIKTSANRIANSDIEGSLSNLTNANSTVYEAANRINQNGTNLAGVSNALVFNADATVQQIGQTLQATGNGVAGDAAATAENATHISYGVNKIRDTHNEVRNVINAVNGDLGNVERQVAIANQALEANPADETVLNHAKNLVVATPGSDAHKLAQDALVNDYAGSNPGAVMTAIDEATNGARNVKSRMGTIDPGSVLEQDLYTMDQTANVMGQTGNNITQGANAVRPTISGITTTDAGLQGALDQIGSLGDAMSADAQAITGNTPLMSTNGVRNIHDDIRLDRDAITSSAQNLETYVTNAKNALGEMPTDATIQGSASELVSSFDANTKAWSDLSTNLAGPQQKLVDAQGKYAADILPSQEAVSAAQDALKMVTVPLGQLEQFAKELPDTVGLGTRLHWNNPVNFFDKGKVDVSKVYGTEVEAILGKGGL
ncbi:MAG: hypothetical protein JWM80_6120 [Cyanobacteria bacterium RYN_339]|nr:hypothetical protein [Cyanobacteria bacterium RYN_339]